MRDQRLWTWHLLAGLAILVFGGLHMAIMHLDATLGIFNPVGGHPVDWGNVVARARSGFFLASYLALLAAALFHGLYGLRNLLFELGPGPGLKRLLDLTLGLGGSAFFVLGAWAAAATFRLAGTL
jgi:succinate dehydrogenase / fumarate reductase membrane anchor subunit